MKHWSKPLVMVALCALGLTITSARPAAAQADRAKPIRKLSVTGHGETQVKPDVATLDVAVETTGATAQEAAQRNAELSQKVVSAVKADVGASGSVWTGSYALFPDYQPIPGGGGSKLVGYRSENSIKVRTDALDKVGSLIDKAIEAGANRINSLAFTVSDDSQARNQAISLAAKDAENEAQALAGALGVKLKRIVDTSVEGKVRPSPLMMGARMATMAGAPTPIEIDRVSVPATVSLVYEIE